MLYIILTQCCFEQQWGRQILSRCLCQPCSFLSHLPWGKKDETEILWASWHLPECGESIRKFYFMILWRLGRREPTDGSARHGTVHHITEETRAERTRATHSPPGKAREENFCFGKRNTKLRKDEKVYLLAEHKWHLWVQFHLKSDIYVWVSSREWIVIEVVSLIG